MNLELRSTQRTLGHWRMSMDLTSTLQRRLVSAWRRWAIILIWVLKPINICDKYIQLFKYNMWHSASDDIHTLSIFLWISLAFFGPHHNISSNLFRSLSLSSFAQVSYERIAAPYESECISEWSETNYTKFLEDGNMSISWPYTQEVMMPCCFKKSLYKYPFKTIQ